jgi:hypothetical protein
VDLLNPPLTSTVHSIFNDGILERPNAVVLGNTEPSTGVHEISINYVNSGKSFDRKTRIIDIYFALLVADTIQNDSDPKFIVKCKKHLSDPELRDCVHNIVHTGIRDRTCPIPYLCYTLLACEVGLADTEGSYSSCSTVPRLVSG